MNEILNKISFNLEEWTNILRYSFLSYNAMIFNSID